ncbi:MAG: hypothetical protein ACI4TJ_00815 [Candidatus Cryptobacteroides sp.]
MLNQKIEKAMMVFACAAVLVACTNNDPDKGKNYADTDLKGRVTSDLTLKAGETYNLLGSLQVVAPAVLTIEPGVTVVAADNGEINYILIEQGAKIIARGTAEKPIVLTAAVKESGAWGGLHICGKAHSNRAAKAGESLTSEIGNAIYGGTDDNDNSGILEYVRLEYTGYKLDAEHEANGISLYGVGRGTRISYVQCYMGSDDGIEFFGGSVCVDHCVVVDCTDDCFDWTEGWNGTAEYLVAYQTDPTCDCLMECDNNGDDFDAKPVAHPVIRNITLVGNNSKDNKKGIRLRAGTEVSLENALVCGKDEAIRAETTQTLTALANGTSVLKNISLSSTFLEKPEDGQSSIYSSEQFLADGSNKVGVDMKFTKRYVGMIDGRGAVDASSDWTEGWCR